MNEPKKNSTLAEARFPVLVLAITMLAPVVLAIGLVIWKTGEEAPRSRTSGSTTKSLAAGEIRLTVTAPGMMTGKVLVSRLDDAGAKTLTLELPIANGLGIGDLALGDPSFEVLIESESHQPKRFRVELSRVTATLVPRE